MARLTFFAPARRVACAAAVAVVLAGTADVARASARSDYERFLARVEAMRLDGPRPTPRPAMRRAVADGEALARRHAASGYADNALWHAATVSLAAWRVYGMPADRTQGLQLLEALVKRYPSSSLVDDARALIRKHTPAAHAKATTRPAPPTPRKPAPAAAAPEAPPAATVSTVATSAVPSVPASGSPALEPAPAAAAVPVSTRTARAAGRLATLRGVRRTQVGDTIRLTLDFDGEVDFDQQRLPGPDRLFFDFARTTPIAALTDTVLHFDGPAVRRVRLGRPKADVTRLAIDLDGVARYSVFALYHPFRLTIDLEPMSAMGPSRAPLSAAATAPATNAPVPSAATRAASPSSTPAPAPPPVPRTGHVPTASAVAGTTTVAPPAPPPAALLHAKRIAPPSAAGPLPPPTRVVVVEPLLAAGDPLPSGTRVAAMAPAVAPRIVTRPTPLLRTRRTQPLMVRAAIRPPRGLPAGLDLAAFVPPAGRRLRTEPAERAAAAAPVAPMPIPTAPAENGSGGFSIARQLGLGVSRIVIDPGHGGKDPGALGSKTTESEVVLDVALRVEKILAAEAGIEVVLTRRTDEFIPLEERTALANRQKADLFLSIHANSSRNRKAAGVETYVLNFASSADAASVAARENASAAGSMRNLPDMVRAITQGNKRDESRELASAVQESMVSRLRPHNAGLRDLGVKQAPFVVLIGAGMPSVLAEIAFISHAGEGSLLKTEKYRQRIAEALAAAVIRYTRTLKPVGTVASQD